MAVGSAAQAAATAAGAMEGVAKVAVAVTMAVSEDLEGSKVARGNPEDHEVQAEILVETAASEDEEADWVDPQTRLLQKSPRSPPKGVAQRIVICPDAVALPSDGSGIREPSRRCCVVGFSHGSHSPAPSKDANFPTSHSMHISPKKSDSGW